MINEWLHTFQGANHMSVKSLFGYPAPAMLNPAIEQVEAIWPGCVVIVRANTPGESDRAIAFAKYIRDNEITYAPWTTFSYGRNIAYAFSRPTDAIQFKLWMG